MLKAALLPALAAALILTGCGGSKSGSEGSSEAEYPTGSEYELAYSKDDLAYYLFDTDKKTVLLFEVRSATAFYGEYAGDPYKGEIQVSYQDAEGTSERMTFKEAGDDSVLVVYRSQEPIPEYAVEFRKFPADKAERIFEESGCANALDRGSRT